MARHLDTWWTGFDDSELTRIVQRVLDQNLDLAQSLARVEQARAAAKEAGAKLKPSGSLTAQSDSFRQSLDSPFGRYAEAFPAYIRNQSYLDLGVEASWEADLFGGLRRGAEAASAEAEAAEAERLGVRVSVVAEAVDAYMRIRRARALCPGPSQHLKGVVHSITFNTSESFRPPGNGSSDQVLAIDINGLLTKEIFMAILNPAILHHTCFLVRDLEGTAQRLSDTLGIGPWNIWTVEPAECKVHGQETHYSFRIALATVGGGTIELTTPHTGQSIYVKHLEKHGEGFHHICVAYPSLERLCEIKVEFLRQGREVVQEGKLGDTLDFAYFHFPEIGSLVEVLYLDTAKLPPPEMVIRGASTLPA
jgi:hypothetical protein